MYFRGSVYSSHKTLFSRLIFPFAQIKKLLEKIYDFILQSIWKELIFGKTIENEVANLILFLIFCLLSLGLFHLQAYRELILGLFFSLWLIDRAIAQHFYQNPNRKSLVSLKITDDYLYLRQYLPKRQTIDLEFERWKIKEITIFPRTLYSEGFQAEIKRCWQVILFLQDETDLLVDEQPSPQKALNKAKILAKALAIPITILDSEGNHPYATRELSPVSPDNSNTIKINLKNNKYHLYSQWRLRDSWQLLKQILVRSGFLIFVIISTNFMIQWGGMIDAFIAPFFSQQQAVIDWPSIRQWFRVDFDLGTSLEIGLAVGIMVFQGAKISRSQHLYLDQSLLKYYVGRHQQGQLKTPEIEAILLIPEPNLAVLIFAKNQALAIDSLPTPDAHREMVEKLEFALNQ